MNKVLISILSGSFSGERLGALYEQFQKHDFTIEVFHDQNNELSLESLPTIIDYLQGQDRFSKGIERITILSNVKDLLLSWYRLYNERVNDFILVSESIEISNKLKEPYRTIIKQLASFAGIEKEQITDKIFVELDIDNYKGIFPFIINGGNHKYFTSMDSFDYRNSYISKKPVWKKYKVNKYEIEVNERIAEKSIFVNTNVVVNDNVEINDTLLTAFSSNAQLTFYLTHYIVNSGTDVQHRNLTLHHLYKGINAESIKKELSDLLLTHVKETNLSFQDKINYLSLIVMLGCNLNVLPEIFNILKQDKDFIHYHYPILTNALFYMSKDKQEAYPKLFQDRIEIMEKVNDYYKSRIKLPSLPNKTAVTNVKRIAIVTGQLLAVNHSPTQVVINYANQLKRHIVNSEVGIIVDDMFQYSQSEVFWPYFYTSANSSNLKVVHKNLLHKQIPVYYSNVHLSREARLKESVNAIIEFKPDIIFKIGAPYSLTVDLLYDYFPVISMTMGGAEDSSFVDIFTGGPTVEYIQKKYEFHEIKGRKYIQHHTMHNFLSSKAKKRRKDYQINKKDYVLVTVGNRLEAELSADFIEFVCTFLNETEDTTWLIVGLTHFDYIEKNYENLLLSGRIKFVSYEKDLVALYKICDVYVNPFRHGGGYSGALAMTAGLPVITLGDCDVAVFAGKENTVQISEFSNELTKLFKDEKYRAEKSESMKSRIKRFSNHQATVIELQKIFEIAKFNNERV